MTKQTNTGRVFNIGGVRIEQVKVEPCWRVVDIMKAQPQRCTCTSCAPRGDLGRIVPPV